MNRRTISEMIIEINTASVTVPLSYLSQGKVASGEALAYINGVIAGRHQAVDIIDEFKQ